MRRDPQISGPFAVSASKGFPYRRLASRTTLILAEQAKLVSSGTTMSNRTGGGELAPKNIHFGLVNIIRARAE